MSLAHARETTRSDAIAAAVQTARDAEALLGNSKTPIGARAIGLAKLAGSWAEIAVAMAMDDEAWRSAHRDLVDEGAR